MNRLTDDTIRDYARQIADSMINDARNSGSDPVVFVTGNSYMPPLRSFTLAERIWQHMTDAPGEEGSAWAFLVEEVERLLDEANVYLASPEYDNCLYVVDLERFSAKDDSEEAETLSDEWEPNV